MAFYVKIRVVNNGQKWYDKLGQTPKTSLGQAQTMTKNQKLEYVNGF